MSRPVPKQDIDRDTVKKWLSDASLGKLNIFHDRNKIIILLCRELLKSWDERGEK